jgi:hypothetical protein
VVLKRNAQETDDFLPCDYVLSIVKKGLKTER